MCMKAPISREELKRRLLECGGISPDDAEDAAVMELLARVEELESAQPYPNVTDAEVEALSREFALLQAVVDAARQCVTKAGHAHWHPTVYVRGEDCDALNVALAALDAQEPSHG